MALDRTPDLCNPITLNFSVNQLCSPTSHDKDNSADSKVDHTNSDITVSDITDCRHISITVADVVDDGSAIVIDRCAMLQVSIITTKSIIVAIVASRDANIDQYVRANLASTIANVFVAEDVVVGATDQGAEVMVAVVITAVRTTEADRMKDPTVTADLDRTNTDTATNPDRTNAATTTDPVQTNAAAIVITMDPDPAQTNVDTILVVITIDHLIPMNAAITTTIVAARPKADLVRMKTFIVVKETDPVRSVPIIRRSYRSSSWATAPDNPFTKMST